MTTNTHSLAASSLQMPLRLPSRRWTRAVTTTKLRSAAQFLVRYPTDPHAVRMRLLIDR
jgi:hypothetical protein